MSEPVLSVLRRHAEKAATEDEVVRALLQHDAWLAPATLFAPRATRGADGRLELDLPGALRLFSQGTNVPARSLLLFTDLDHTQHPIAAGAQLGSYVELVSGLAVFGLLDAARYGEVRVNPNAPTADTFFVPSDAFGMLKLWASAIALEKRLAAPGLSPSLLAELGGFPGFQVFLDEQTKDVLTLQRMAPDIQSAAMVFTAPDCAAAMRKRLPATQAIKSVTVGGDRLFPFLIDQRVDGVIFNPVGPGTQALFPASLLRAVLEPQRPTS